MSNIYSQTFSVLHIAVGASCLLTPSYTLDLMGFPPMATFLTRVFGSRDLAIGYSIWTSASHTARRSAIMIAVAINALDLISGLISYAQGELSEKAVMWGPGQAGLLLGIGVLALR